MILECILAIFILSIGFGLLLNMVKVDNKSFKIRDDMRTYNILFGNVISEIKFNTTIEELEERFKENKIKIGIDKDIFKKLKTENILNIDSKDIDKFIEIIKIKNDDDKLLLNFKLLENNEDVILEKEVEKELWMEERELKEVIH